MNDDHLPKTPLTARLGWVFSLLVCAAYCAATLPNLHRLEFFDGVEHFTLATVQEMKRGDAELPASGLARAESYDLAKTQAANTSQSANWLLPTLEGEPRVVKPPMTAWLTAALVSPDTIRELSSRNPAVRAAAFDRFVFAARLPTLFCTVLMLLGVYQLGRVTIDPRGGVFAVLVCASFLLFLFQSRRATTDLQLAVWVTWTSALLATAIFQNRPRLGYIGAGIALGLATMAKGPHIALLLTVAPVAVFLIWQSFVIPRYAEGSRASSAADSSRSLGVPRDDGSRTSTPKSPFAPILIGLFLAGAIGLWWYAYVLYKVPGVMDHWRREMFRRDVNLGRNILKPDPWYAYSMIFGLLMPWTPWVFLGAWRAMCQRCQSLRLPLLMLVLPIVVMSFFSEKKTRYLLPFVAPAAVLAAAGIGAFIDNERARRRQRISNNAAATAPSIATSDEAYKLSHRWLYVIAAIITLISVAWLTVGVAVAGAIGINKTFRDVAGQPWFSPASAAVMAAAGALLLIAAVVFARRTLILSILAIVLATWLGSEIRLRGDSLTPGDADDRPQRELAAMIWRDYPGATIYSADPATLYGQLNRAAIVLSIHTNRIVYTKPDTLPTQKTGHPLVLITDSIQTIPPVPPGWKRLTELPLRTGKRYVDVLE